MFMAKFSEGVTVSGKTNCKPSVVTHCKTKFDDYQGNHFRFMTVESLRCNSTALQLVNKIRFVFDRLTFMVTSENTTFM